MTKLGKNEYEKNCYMLELKIFQRKTKNIWDPSCHIIYISIYMHNYMLYI